MVILLSQSASNGTLSVLHAPKNRSLMNPSCLLSSLFILAGVLIVTEFSILILNGLLKVLSLLIGQTHNLIHCRIALSIATFFIWNCALLLFGSLECDSLFRHLITINRIRSGIMVCTYPFLVFFYSSLVSRRLFFALPFLALMSFFVSVPAWDWSWFDDVLCIISDALSSMLPNDAWNDLAASLPQPRKLVSVVALSRFEVSVWVVEDTLRSGAPWKRARSSDILIFLETGWSQLIEGPKINRFNKLGD